MRLVSYREPGTPDDAPWHAGVVVGSDVVDAEDCARKGSSAQSLPSVRGLLALPADDLADIGRAAEASAARVGALDTLVLGPPVPDAGKILCIGLNYAEHAEETKLDPSAVPTVFAKFANSLVGHGAAIVPPPATSQVDYEGELAVVIGRRCRRLAPEEVNDVIGGVMPLNDVSARDLQFQTPQWTPGKAVDTFAPCGPALVLMDEVEDVADLRVLTRVNGRVVQNARTSQMIFDIPRIVSFLSSFMTLEVGDIIATGTPAGVGFTREPPLLLADGDEVEVEVEGIGVLRNPVSTEATADERARIGNPALP